MDGSNIKNWTNENGAMKNKKHIETKQSNAVKKTWVKVKKQCYKSTASSSYVKKLELFHDQYSTAIATSLCLAIPQYLAIKTMFAIFYLSLIQKFLPYARGTEFNKIR